MRLFLAVELSPPIRQRLQEVRLELGEELSGWRWVRQDGIHLTLRFLGEVPPEADARHRRAWGVAAAGCRPVRFAVGGIGTFPQRGSARVLWVGIHDIGGGRLAALAAALEAAARDEGFPAETRPFRPHLTLARALRGGRPTRPRPASVGELGVVDAREVVLFRSELSPTGARYTALEAFSLGGADAAG